MAPIVCKRCKHAPTSGGGEHLPSPSEHGFGFALQADCKQGTSLLPIDRVTTRFPKWAAGDLNSGPAD
jgi:hypothetical protein